MGILMDSAMLAPLKDAQEDLGVRLDALLVELQTIRVLLEATLGADVNGAAAPSTNGSSSRKRARAS